MTTITIRIPEETKSALEALAVKQNRTLTGQVLLILTAYLTPTPAQGSTTSRMLAEMKKARVLEASPSGKSVLTDILDELKQIKKGLHR